MGLEDIKVFNFDIDKIKLYVKDNFDDYNKALIYLELVLKKYMGSLPLEIKKKWENKILNISKFSESGLFKISNADKEYLINLKKLMDNDTTEIDNFLQELRLFSSELNNQRMNHYMISTNDKGDEIYTELSGKMKWCDNNYLSLMGLIELLEYAGYVQEGSYKNSGEIAANLFLKKDGKAISRKGFNNKKKHYEKNKVNILGKLLDDLKKANNRIIS